MPSGKDSAPPKSILKNKTISAAQFGNEHQPPRPSGPATAPTNSSRNYQLALQHANLIQARRDIEALVLAALEEFLDFPTTPDASASAPSAADLDRFQALIQPFQSSDYDELFEERNLVEKCGYVFCPNKRRTEPNRGPLRLTRGAKKGDGLQILTAKQTEMWCSEQCARRALFIKVQLLETPAWERLGGMTRPIEVLDEKGQDELEAKMQQLDIVGQDGAELESAMEQLALERGENASTPASSNRQREVMAQSLVEKPDISEARAPASTNTGDAGHIEGYRPGIAP